MLKLSKKLYPDNPSEAEAFLAALKAPHERKAIVCLRDDSRIHINEPQRYPWQPDWILSVPDDVQAGKLPEHERGEIYVLDMSSVFAASVLRAVSLDQVGVVLDLCASPGGKSAFSWRLFHPELLAANEVINKRIPGLISNIKRCALGPSIVTTRDPSFFAQVVPECASIVLVDAPCSGQSLIVKGDKSSGCFHNSTINMNSNRQKRIIAQAADAVSPGGYLAYMTCTFSPEENEKVVKWFLKRFPQFSAVICEELKEFQSFLTDTPCYRLMPQTGIGAGAFTALFRKDGEPETDGVERYRSLNPVYRFEGTSLETGDRAE